MSSRPRLTISLLDADGRRRWGTTPVVAAFLPQLVEPRRRFLRSIDEGVLDEAMKELVRIRNARVTDCEY